VKASIFSRAKAYLDAMPAGVSGRQGHDATFKAAVALIHGFALSDEDAWPLLVEFNKRCKPPWSGKELAHKLQDARKVDRHPLPYGHLLNNGSRRLRAQCYRVKVPEPAKPRILGRIVCPDIPPLPPEPAGNIRNEAPVPTGKPDFYVPPLEKSFREQAMEFWRSLRQKRQG
jgi:hypothetical protein